MSKIRSTILFQLFTATVFLSTPVLAAEELNLVGEYVCEGKNPDGSAYKGDVTISKKGDSLLVTWKYTGKQYEGIALVAERTLSVCWVQKSDRGVSVGIGTYTMRMDGKTLDGKWSTFGGDGSVRKETLTRVPEKDDKESAK